MDLRAAVAVHLCLLAAGASCDPGGLPEATKESLNQTAQLLTKDLQPLLTNLSVIRALTNRPCRHLDGTQLGGSQERPLTGTHLSFFSCYTLKLSNRSHTSNMQTELMVISQRLDSMAALMLNPTLVNCSLPDLRGIDLFHYVRCLLQRLDHRLRHATF